MGKRGKSNNTPKENKVYWQSAEMNQRWQQFFASQLKQLALARFRWINLPETCDARYLELNLLFQGVATIAAPKFAPDMFLSLKAVLGGIDMYGNASNWRALGENGTDFACDNSNAVLVYDNMLRSSMSGTFNLLAYDMSDIVRTAQVNRMHIKTPVFLVGDQTLKQQMENIFKQMAGHEPGIIATRSIQNVDFEAVTTGVPYLGRELDEALMNAWNRAFTFLGISNLPFKSERQTADEIRDYGEPTELLTLNPLSCRRRACEQWNDRFATRVWGRETPKLLDCVQNEDVESKGWNAIHNMEKLLGLEGDAK